MDVVREAQTVYRNYRSNPSESFFARVSACYDDYVLSSFQVEFDRQAYQVFPGDVSDVMQAVKCLERSIYLGLKAVAIIAGGDIVLPDPYPLDVYEPQGYVPNNFKFVCYGGTALRLTLKGFENESCGDNEFPRKKPPTPPPPPETVPSGTPIEVSPPEPDYPDDTDPFDGDTEDEGTPDFPIGEECQVFEVSLRAIGSNSTTPPGDAIITLEVFGVIEDIRIEPEPGLPTFERLVVVCGGLSFTECMQGQSVSFAGAATGLLSFEIISILPVV